MTSNNRWIAVAYAALLSVVPIAAEATISRAIAFDDKVENAASIVVGRLVSQQSQWDPAREWILTYSTFEIEKTLKGAPAQQMTIVTPGGRVGNIAQEVVGVPKFRSGDEHVLFVRNSQAGATVLYLEQGAYRVEKNDRGERIVQPLVSSAVLVDTQRGKAVVPESARPLSEFEGKVRETIRRREAIRMEMIEHERKQQASIWKQVEQNKTLLALALVGAMLAAWQYFRRM